MTVQEIKDQMIRQWDSLVTPLPKEQYREVLEEMQSYFDGLLEGLDEEEGV